MAKRKTSFREKASNLFHHPHTASGSSLPPLEITAEEQAELEREQEEEDLRELKRMEEEEVARIAETERQKLAAEEAQRQGGEGEKKKGSKERFKEREARKAAALAAAQAPIDDAEDSRKTAEIEKERESLKATCDALGFEVFEIQPDGHCLYSAIADQLALLGILSPKENTYATTRFAAADYIASHSDDFIPFLPSVSGEDGAGAEDDGLMTPKQLQEYVRLIKETGEWGGEPEILALARRFDVPIHVIQCGPPNIVAHSPVPNAKGKLTVEESLAERAVRITFHTKMYGLGAHYNSLRRPIAGVKNTFFEDN